MRTFPVVRDCRMAVSAQYSTTIHPRTDVGPVLIGRDRASLNCPTPVNVVDLQKLDLGFAAAHALPAQRRDGVVLLFPGIRPAVSTVRLGLPVLPLVLVSSTGGNQ